MKKNKDSYKNSPNIIDQVNNNKKFAEGLKKIIDIIENDKLQILLLGQILIYHGLMIQKIIKKLVKILLIDIIKINIRMNYFLLILL